MCLLYKTKDIFLTEKYTNLLELTDIDNYFSDKHGTGIVWNDKELNIDWRVDDALPVIVSERDSQHPTFKEFKEKYGGV